MKGGLSVRADYPKPDNERLTSFDSRIAIKGDGERERHPADDHLINSVPANISPKKKQGSRPHTHTRARGEGREGARTKNRMKQGGPFLGADITSGREASRRSNRTETVRYYPITISARPPTFLGI